MLFLTGALGRQFSLVLSGIAKGRGAGLFVRDGSITVSRQKRISQIR